LLLAPLAGCNDDPIPKPRGYFRIDLPAPDSVRVQSNCPFTAEIPSYGRLVQGLGAGTQGGDACWTDLVFPGQHASVHMTWRHIQGDLAELVHDAHEFKAKHEAMASRIRTEEVLRDSADVFGTIFDVDGNVASPMVFYLTDSTSNFLYGALYFDARPNADSLAPVTRRIRADIRRFARTLRWNGPAGAVQHVQQRGQ
jgi:gliding motility-associated lipoprotein GldD